MTDPLVSVKVRGLRQLASGSRRLGGEIHDAAGDAFLDVAETTRGIVAGRVPHVSGQLAGSAGADLDRSSNTASVTLGEGVPYAGWIEFGGGRYRGRPYVPAGRYLYPTALNTARGLESAGEHAASSEIRRFHWPRPR